MEAAQKDGIVTEQELEIIRQVEVDADSFNVILTEAQDDGVISSREKSKLEKLKVLITDRAETIASLDGVIDKDEKAILSTLADLIANHYKLN